jgi:Tol biopolymer transport system component
MLRELLSIFIISGIVSFGFAQESKEDLRKPPQIMIRGELDTIKQLLIREMLSEGESSIIQETSSQLIFKRVPPKQSTFTQILAGGKQYNLVTLTLNSVNGEVLVILDTDIAVVSPNGEERKMGSANGNKKYREQIKQRLATVKAKVEAMPPMQSAMPTPNISNPPITRNEAPPLPAKVLVFSSTRDGNQEVYLLESATGKQTNLSQNPSAEDGYPRFSPDGQRIAFSTNRNGKWQIFLMNHDGSAPRLLTDGGYADWSPDGQSLVFALNRKGYNEIYTINANGTGLKQLTSSGKESVHPAWSPDGKKIVFASEKTGNRQLYVMNADGSNSVRLSNSTGYDDYPAWSPDGKQIAFASDRDSRNSAKLELYVINADGTAVRRITNHPDDDRHPVWSADGMRITFVSDRNGSRDIFAMVADGTGTVEKLISALGNDEHPCWLSKSAEIQTVVQNSPSNTQHPVKIAFTRELFEQMVREKQIERGCLQEVGGKLEELFYLTTLDLNRDGKSELQLTGKNCTCNGGKRCAIWIYEKTEIEYRRIFGQESNIEEIAPEKSSTNGYQDLGFIMWAGDTPIPFQAIFDGQRYQVNEHKISENPKTARSMRQSQSIQKAKLNSESTPQNKTPNKIQLTPGASATSIKSYLTKADTQVYPNFIINLKAGQKIFVQVIPRDGYFDNNPKNRLPFTINDPSGKLAAYNEAFENQVSFQAKQSGDFSIEIGMQTWLERYLKEGLKQPYSLSIKTDLLPESVFAHRTESALSQPPVPKEYLGACPFEGCNFNRWKVNKPINFYAERNEISSVVFRAKKNERVQAITGVQIITTAGQLKIIKPVTENGIRLNQGELYYFTREGAEGGYEIWYKGKSLWVEGTVYYEVIKRPESVWWVKVRNAKGQIGWTKQSSGEYLCIPTDSNGLKC